SAVVTGVRVQVAIAETISVVRVRAASAPTSVKFSSHPSPTAAMPKPARSAASTASTASGSGMPGCSRYVPTARKAIPSVERRYLRGVHVHSLNWFQLERYLERDDRIVLPLGSTEQHAYLSLGTDTINAERVALAAAEPLGVPVLPALPYGVTPSLTAYPGS